MGHGSVICRAAVTVVCLTGRQDKKKAEEERQKELAALFAVAIKQPKVPVGALA